MNNTRADEIIIRILQKADEFNETVQEHNAVLNEELGIYLIDIVLDYLGVPPDSGAIEVEHGTEYSEDGYCRDYVYEILFDCDGDAYKYREAFKKIRTELKE